MKRKGLWDRDDGIDFCWKRHRQPGRPSVDPSVLRLSIPRRPSGMQLAFTGSIDSLRLQGCAPESDIEPLMDLDRGSPKKEI